MPTPTQRRAGSAVASLAFHLLLVLLLIGPLWMRAVLDPIMQGAGGRGPSGGGGGGNGGAGGSGQGDDQSGCTFNPAAGDDLERGNKSLLFLRSLLCGFQYGKVNFTD